MAKHDAEKWFNDSRSFGCITPDKRGDDLFAHFSEVRDTGFKALAEGQKVSYETERCPKGLHASNITALSRYRMALPRLSDATFPP